MIKALTAVALLFVMVGTMLAGAADAIIFKKVDVFEMEGDDEKKRDARMELDSETRILSLVDEKKGIEKATYAVIPYDAITKIIYEKSKHRRYGAGLLINPFLLFSKGKKHWLTIEFTDVADLPQGYVYMRLDKKNQRQILSALGAGTGIEIEQIIED
jgi:hypothetical protein